MTSVYISKMESLDLDFNFSNKVHLVEKEESNPNQIGIQKLNYSSLVNLI